MIMNEDNEALEQTVQRVCEITDPADKVLMWSELSTGPASNRSLH